MHNPSIPLTPQTDPRNFPVWADRAPPGRSGHPYPKMLTRAFTKEDRDVWQHKNKKVDVTTQREYYEERCPKVGDPVPIISTIELVDAGLCDMAGEPIVVRNAEEEASVYETLGLKPQAAKAAVMDVPIPVASGPSARERELEAETKRLRAQLDAATTKPKKKKKKKRAAPVRMSLDQMAV